MLPAYSCENLQTDVSKYEDYSCGWIFFLKLKQRSLSSLKKPHWKNIRRTIKAGIYSFKSSDSCPFSKKRNSTQDFSLMLNSLSHIQIYRAFKRFFSALVIASLQNIFWNSINSFLRIFNPGSCVYLILKSLAFTSLQKRYMEKIRITFNSILKFANMSKFKVLF